MKRPGCFWSMRPTTIILHDCFKSMPRGSFFGREGGSNTSLCKVPPAHFLSTHHDHHRFVRVPRPSLADFSVGAPRLALQHHYHRNPGTTPPLLPPPHSEQRPLSSAQVVYLHAVGIRDPTLNRTVSPTPNPTLLVPARRHPAPFFEATPPIAPLRVNIAVTPPHGIRLIPWALIETTISVASAGVCTISSIQQIGQARLSVPTYSNAATPHGSVVVACATFDSGAIRRVQRVILGQLWCDELAVHSIHFLGKMLSFLCSDRVTIYGLAPQEALRTWSRVRVPTMMELWLSVDPGDHNQGTLLDLQRATALFTHEGLLTACPPNQLLALGARRRVDTTTGLPVLPMSVEATAQPYGLVDEEQVEVFVYAPRG